MNNEIINILTDLEICISNHRPHITIDNYTEYLGGFSDGIYTATSVIQEYISELKENNNEL